jgi:hypothetical protein
VEDGVITGLATTGHPNPQTQWLVWQGGEVGDFELKLKVRIQGGFEGNSGLQFRTTFNSEDTSARHPNPPTPGEKVYLQTCAGCHGDDRMGQGVVPPLQGLSRRLKDEEVLLILRSGRGRMPPISFLTRDQQKDLLDFLFLRDRVRDSLEKTRPQYPFNGYFMDDQADLVRDPPLKGLSYDEGAGRQVLAHRGEKTVIDEGGHRKTKQFAEPGRLGKAIKLESWNEYLVIARGNHLQAIINGQLMSEVIDYDKENFHNSGWIGLQLQGGSPMKVQFKDIVLKKYPSAKPTVSLARHGRVKELQYR